MNSRDQNELLARYFAGEANDAECAAVEAWRKASQENQRRFAEYESVWQNSGEKLPALPDVDQAWQELRDRLELPGEQPARSLTMKNPATIAKRRFSWSDRYLWAAAAALVLAFATLLYEYSKDSAGLQKIRAASGQRERLTLPDGSIVQLNSASEIQFHRNFADTARDVTLLGEAYFDIAHDGRPFSIKTGNAQVRVLGTKFGVWARNEETRVTVREGRVALRALSAPPNKAVELAANQMSVCRQQNEPEPPQIVDAKNSLGWLEGRIVFEQTPLTEVIAELQRSYNVTIALSDSALGRLTITGSFHNKTIESVLASICLTLDLQYAQQAGKYMIGK